MTLPANIRAGLASVMVATILVALKLYAVWDTGSVAMLGSLADTILDLVASLATLFQVVLISLSAFGIAIRAIEQFATGARTTAADSGIAVSVIALLLTLALVAYQRRVIARTGSIAIKTDAVHYQSDLLLNLAVIAALLLDHRFGLTGADPLFGLAIAAWLLWGAYRGSGEAIDQLMDREWPEARRRAFLQVANQHPELAGIHELRTRTSGNQDFVQFHVWVDPAMTIGEAHRVMDEVEAKLMAAFPGVEILIHPDPIGHVDRPMEHRA